MNQEEYIKKWLNGTLSAKEKEEFEQTQDYLFLKRLDRSLKHFKAPEYSEPVPVHAQKRKPITRSLSWENPILRAAASVLLVLGALFAYVSLTKDDTTEVFAEKRQELFLPDSSKVILNAQSSITYSIENWSVKRKVSLEGEAFFTVRSGSTFDVNTKGGVVSVVGTAFNVKSRKEFFEVVCYEGKVLVKSQDKQIVLTENDGWRVIHSKAEEVNAHPTTKPLWTIGESHFDSVPFHYVIEEFERQYEVKIKTENVHSKRLFSGSFGHDNINLALKAITLPLNLSFEIEEDQITLSNKP